MVAISNAGAKEFNLVTNETASLFGSVEIDDPKTLSWDKVAGGQGAITITLQGPGDFDFGTIVDPLVKDFNAFTETKDAANQTVTFTEKANVVPGANSAPTGIVQRLIYIAPPTTGQAAYDIHATVSYSGTELDASPYPTPSTVKPVTVSLEKPVVVHFSPFGGEHYPTEMPTPTNPPAQMDPMNTIANSSDSNTLIVASGGTAAPFADYNITRDTHNTWDSAYDGNGLVTITLHAVTGPLGTLTDDISKLAGTPAKQTAMYDQASNTYTFTEQSTEVPTAPVVTPNDILDHVVYHAPQTTTGTDVFATISFTGKVATNNPYPTPNTLVTQTVTYPDQLDLSVRTPDQLGPVYTGPVAGGPVVTNPPVPDQPAPVPVMAPDPTPDPITVPDPTPAPQPVSMPDPQPASAPASVITRFAIQDSTTGQSSAVPGDDYTGPVGGLQHELIMISPDNLAISAAVPNSFIHTGSGTDAIDVSGVSGNNVLDGGTGSNFLIGGAGLDTFFVDARNAPASTWSTVGNFHAGDAVTLWGLTAQAFQMSWADNQGAAGREGLTLHASAAGKPDASLTLSGYSTADLNNGRLAMVFGSNAGGNYLYIHGS